MKRLLSTKLVVVLSLISANSFAASSALSRSVTEKYIELAKQKQTPEPIRKDFKGLIDAGCSTVEKTVEELKRAGDELENKKWLERGVSGSVVLCLVFDSEDTYGEGAGLYQGVLIPKDATASTVNFSKEDIETVGFED